MTLFISQAERFLGISQSVVDAANRLLSNSGMAASDTCPNGGSTTVSYSDNDGSMALSAGDTLHINFTQCFLPKLSDVAQGNIDAVITQMNPPSPGIDTMSANLNFGDQFFLGDTGQISVLGVYGMAYGFDTIQAETLFDQTVTFTFPGGEEDYTYFEVSQSTQSHPDYEVEIEIEGTSGRFNTGYVCGYQVLTGTVDSPPSSGEVLCTADDGSAIGAIASPAQLALDSDGDDDFEFSMSANVFSDATTGYLFGDSPQ